MSSRNIRIGIALLGCLFISIYGIYAQSLKNTNDRRCPTSIATRNSNNEILRSTATA